MKAHAELPTRNSDAADVQLEQALLPLVRLLARAAAREIHDDQDTEVEDDDA